MTDPTAYQEIEIAGMTYRQLPHGGWAVLHGGDWYGLNEATLIEEIARLRAEIAAHDRRCPLDWTTEAPDD